MSNLNEGFGFTGALSRATLAEGTSAATIKITNSGGYDFAINGIVYTKATTDNIAMTALSAQAANTTCAYLVQTNSAGTFSMKKGTELGAADYALAGSTVEVPKPDADRCPVGVIKVVTVSGFTSGTTDLAAAGTVTYFDVCGIPTGRV